MREQERGLGERKRKKVLPPTDSLLKCQGSPGLAKAEAGSQDLNPGLEPSLPPPRAWPSEKLKLGAQLGTEL